MQHDVGQAERLGAIESPLEAFEAFGTGGGVAEAAGEFDGLRRGVILAGEAEHGAGHAKAGGLGGHGHVVPFVPRGMMRIAARDLYDIGAEAVHQAFQFGNVLDLQRPAANADRERFDGHEVAPE